MEAKRLATKEKKIVLITLEKAIGLSDGYFIHKQTFYDLFWKKKLTRYGPKLRAMVDLYEFCEYIGKPVTEDILKSI